MDKSFYTGNRQALYEALPDEALAIVLSGRAIRKSADAFYPFFANRNFAYLTGIGGTNAQGFMLTARKKGGAVEETLYILPPDPHAERWTGRRVKADEARASSGVERVEYVENFRAQLALCLASGVRSVWMDFDKPRADLEGFEAHAFAEGLLKEYPFLRMENLHPILRALRTIKKPCEIDAMRSAMRVTREAILDMMRASKPGMKECEYKAIYDAALTRNGVLYPGFPPIISAGNNNFCIHYDAFEGTARDGDMILADVGACYDFLGNDVSRGFPCNGVFSERQRMLYTCAYNTSKHMFSIIRPGMPMADVDKTARRYCYEQLRGIGLLDSYDDIGKYMWHGGAHHVGFDTHDVVDMTRPVSAGMVFCVDIGIYCEEWGIGFRLEDNCHVLPDGCENLSEDIPRSIGEIEAEMRKTR